MNAYLSFSLTVGNNLELNPLPDPHRQEDSCVFVSFASIEEMDKFFTQEESGSQSQQTNDLTQIKGWKNKLQQLTQPSPLSSSSPTISNLPKSFKSNDSEFPQASSVFSDLSDAPGTSMDNELTIHEEITSQEEFEREILSLTTEEYEANLGSENITSAEFSQFAISTVSAPPTEQKNQRKKSSRRASTSLRPSTSKKVPTTPKENVDVGLGDPVLYKDHQVQYGKLATISICNYT